MEQLLSYNGNILERDEFRLQPDNRAFRYGDGIFETIRIEKGIILWSEKHFRRISESARLLHMNVGNSWDQERFENDILSLYYQNHPDHGPARIRYSLFRNAGGLYTPLTNTASWLIESENLDSPFFSLNTRGLEVSLYTEIPKSTNKLSNLKAISALIYVMAGIYKRDQGLGECILVNDHGGIVESTSSNIFIIKNQEIITPPLSEGCVDGVMRSVMLGIFSDKGIHVKEKPITPKDLNLADEVFLSNTIQGIRWVSRFKDKTYQNRETTVFVHMLNTKASDYCKAKAASS